MHALCALAGITDAFQPAATARWLPLAVAGACARDAASRPPRPVRAQRCRAPFQPTGGRRDSQSPRGLHAQAPPAWGQGPEPALPRRARQEQWQLPVPCRQAEHLSVTAIPVPVRLWPAHLWPAHLWPAHLWLAPAAKPLRPKRGPQRGSQPLPRWAEELPRSQGTRPLRRRRLEHVPEPVQQQALALRWRLLQALPHPSRRRPARHCPRWAPRRNRPPTAPDWRYALWWQAALH
jgi:hypothetical protein